MGTENKNTETKGNVESKPKRQVDAQDILLVIVSVAFGIVLASVLNIDIFPAATPTGGTVIGDITMVVLNSLECTTCDVSAAVATTNSLFSEAKITYVDIASAEGQALADTYGIKVLPAFIFSGNIANHANFAQLGPYANKVKDNYVLKSEATGSTWIIDPVERAKAIAELAAKKAAAVTCLEKTLTADTVIFLHSNSCPHCMVMKPIVEKMTEYKFHMAETTTGVGMAPVTECLAGLTNGGVPEFICVGTLNSAVGEMPAENLKAFAATCA